MPSRRILLINHEYPPLGGMAGNATRHIARGLAKLGHKPYVLTTAWPGLPETEERDGVVIKRIASRRADMRHLGANEGARFIANALWVAQGLARQWKIDIALPFFTLPAAPVALFLKRRRFIPYVVALQAGDVPRRTPRHSWTMEALIHRGVRHLWRSAGAVVALSDHLADAARGFDPHVPIDVIPYGADVDGVTPKESYVANGDVRLLYVGRLEKPKGLDVLLAALAKVSSALKWRLTFAGDGSEWPVVAALAGRYALIDRIELLGWQGWNTLPPLYRGADLFVLPSHIEDSMPAALLEAMASGLPVVSTRVTGASEAVLDQQTGLLVPPGDSDALADALTRAMVDPTCWEPLGRAGRARIESYYSWTNVAEKWVDVIERVLAKPSSVLF
jgi:glycosyltransferase involved in cell wall biosynthesis